MPGKFLLRSLGGMVWELGTVKQAQQRGLQHVGEMVPQGDLVAAQLLSLAVQKRPGASAHK